MKQSYMQKNVHFSHFVASQGKWQSKSMKVWQSWMGWKMPLCKWHTFWMVSRLICYLNFILFFIERKWLFMRNLATILLLKSKLSRKFQRFNAIDGSIKMLKKKLNFKKLHLNWKIVKHFLRAKQRVPLRKLFCLPQPTTSR